MVNHPMKDSKQTLIKLYKQEPIDAWRVGNGGIHWRARGGERGVDVDNSRTGCEPPA